MDADGRAVLSAEEEGERPGSRIFAHWRVVGNKIRACAYVCIYIYIYMYMYMSMYIYICIYVCI